MVIIVSTFSCKICIGTCTWFSSIGFYSTHEWSCALEKKENKTCTQNVHTYKIHHACVKSCLPISLVFGNILPHTSQWYFSHLVNFNIYLHLWASMPSWASMYMLSKFFITMLTMERFFTTVGSLMYIQLIWLSKAFHKFISLVKFHTNVNSSVNRMMIFTDNRMMILTDDRMMILTDKTFSTYITLIRTVFKMTAWHFLYTRHRI